MPHYHLPKTEVLMKYFLLLMLLFTNLNAKEYRIYTDTWSPYVEPDGKGSSQKVANIIFNEFGGKINWFYFPYDYAFYLVRTKAVTASYPYFYTEERAQSVLFSDPVFKVSSYFYFNRQFNKKNDVLTANALAKDIRIGMVSGYSYGKEIDSLLTKATIFTDEKVALQALLSGKIDVLPMTESVLNHYLNNYFFDESQLIVKLKSIHAEQTLHMIASKTKAGEDLINQVNRALTTLKKNEISSIALKTTPLKEVADHAVLESTDEFPVILGREKPNDSDYLALPAGTKAIVVRWSDKFTNKNKGDRIYKSMMSESKLVILNGPHIGKELLIKNLHIRIIGD